MTAETDPDGNPSGESERQRLTRNISELMQELRVAQAGVQILFAFLLSVAFTQVFQDSSAYVHTVHLITVLLAAGSTLLLTAPAAWHRVLFRQGERPEIIDAGNRFAIGGLALLAGAMTGTVLLVGEVIVTGWAPKIIGAAVGMSFLVVWFVLPARRRDRPVP